MEKFVKEPCTEDFGERRLKWDVKFVFRDSTKLGNSGLVRLGSNWVRLVGLCSNGVGLLDP